MTAGQKDTWKPLQLLILLGLLFLSRELEVRGQEDESAALHHLRGTTGWEFPDRMKNPAEPSLITDQLLLHNDEDLFFWEHLEGQTMDACPPSVSHSFRQKLLVRTETLNKTVRQEYSADPLKPEPVSTKSPDTEACESEVKRNSEVKRFGSSSEDGLDGNKTTDIQEFLIHHLEAALERKQENHQLMDHPDSGSWYQSPQRAADPVPQFDHQQILLLQDDHVVQSAAAHLYNKHPSVSSVHVLDQNQRPKQVQGEPVPLSENSSLVLVGHGARDGSGQTRISGFTYRDVARIIQSCSRMGHRIRTTTVVACDVGSDEQFVEDLLKTLHEAGVQTELHLWRTVVQVTETGQIISQDMSPDGPQWRHEDSTKKVVVTVGRNGELRRTAESLWKGEAVFTNTTDFLQPGAQNELMNDWPLQPKTFIDPAIYENIDQNKVEQLEERFNELESFSWALFHPEQPVPQRVDVNHPDFNIGNFVLGTRSIRGDQIQINWMDEAAVRKELQQCFVIGLGGDMRNIIRHFARYGENGNTYLMVNTWIFLIDPGSLYVYPAGKQLQNEETQNGIKDIIQKQGREGSESYTSLRANIPNNDRKRYGYFVKNLFVGEPTNIKDPKTELFMTWYFTASCISESIRNFRTFPLTLMALFMDEKHPEWKLDFWFNQHPMARGGSWIDQNRRGFSGSAAPSIHGLAAAQRNKLVEVLKAEDEMFETWRNVLPKSNRKRDVELEAMRQMVNRYCPLQQIDAGFIENCQTFLNSIHAQ